MGDALVTFITKAPVGAVGLLLGTVFVLLAIVGQFQSRWISITLHWWQRAALFVLGAGAAGWLLAFNSHVSKINQLPVVDIPIVEQDGIVTLDDAGRPLFVRAVDIHRLRGESDEKKRFAELEFDLRPNFVQPPVQKNVYPKRPVVFELGGRSYKAGYSRMGQLEAPTDEKNAVAKDVILLSIERLP